MSTVPRATPLSAAVISFCERKRLISAISSPAIWQSVHHENLVVLLASSGRREQRHPAPGDRHEGGAQRDLGFAKTHVTA